jgi:hypothetical protein
MMPRHQQTHLSEHALTAIQLSLGPQHAFPQQSTVLDLFCEQKENAPDRPALRYRDTTMTYADLDAAANVTANRLIGNGVLTRQLIPVLVPDGPEFPASLFAVMKTGSAFVPLDPAWPIDRLRAIVTELAPPAIVASPTTADIVAELESTLPTVIIDCAFGVLADRCGLERVGYAQFWDRLEAIAETDERLLPPSVDCDAAPVEFDQMFTDCIRHFDTERFNHHADSLAKSAADGLKTLERYLSELTDLSALVPQER